MADLPTGYLVHAIDGRLRVRVPERRRDAAYFTRAAQALASCSGVEAVEANTLTSSLLIVHTTTVDKIAEHAHACGVFELENAPPPVTEPAVSDRWLAALADTNRLFSQASEGRADLGTVLAAMFIMIAIIQMARGRIAIPAISALWYALGALTIGRRMAEDPKHYS